MTSARFWQIPLSATVSIERPPPPDDVRERSHMTSAAEGGGGFKMLTRGGDLSLADVSKNT